MSAFKSQRFDVVLMDMQMPEVDGLTATRLVRAHENEADLGRTPVIMVSASSTPLRITQAADAGCDAFLTKPITVKDLCGALALAGKTPRGLY